MRSNNNHVQVISAVTLFVIGVLACLLMHVVPALLVGLLVFVATNVIFNKLDATKLSTSFKKWGTACIVIVGASMVIGLLTLSIAGFISAHSINGFVEKLSETITQFRTYLPATIAAYIPDSLVELKLMAFSSVKEHANTLALKGRAFLHHALLMFIAGIVGFLLALNRGTHTFDADKHRGGGAFETEWLRLWLSLTESFKQIAFAQTKIALVNAVLTGVFILVILPLLGWHIPYAKLLILATLLFGLIPIVGNLVSNTLIVLLAISVAFPAAVTALIFLVVVHKLEYLLNSRIQGGQIGVKSWELLLVLFIFELLFGLAGMVASPIIYAVIKKELKRVNWIV
jgi:predicted PurR-regulated permease PerM